MAAGKFFGSSPVGMGWSPIKYLFVTFLFTIFNLEIFN